MAVKKALEKLNKEQLLQRLGRILSKEELIAVVREKSGASETETPEPAAEPYEPVHTEEAVPGNATTPQPQTPPATYES